MIPPLPLHLANDRGRRDGQEGRMSTVTHFGFPHVARPFRFTAWAWSRPGKTLEHVSMLYPSVRVVHESSTGIVRRTLSGTVSGPPADVYGFVATLEA